MPPPLLPDMSDSLQMPLALSRSSLPSGSPSYRPTVGHDQDAGNYDLAEREPEPPLRRPSSGFRPARKKKKHRRIVHENSVLLMSLAGGLLALAIALILIWAGDYTSKTQWTATVFMVLAWISCGFAVRGMVVRPLQTLSNMHAAIREGDFSMRARSAGRFDALSMLMFE